MDLKDTITSLDLKQQISVVNVQINGLDDQRSTLLKQLDLLTKQLNFALIVINDSKSRDLCTKLFNEINNELN